MLLMPLAHFGLGFSVAWLLSWLTLTISRSLGLPVQRTSPWVWLLALSGAVLSHIWEDYGLGWF